MIYRPQSCLGTYIMRARCRGSYTSYALTKRRTHSSFENEPLNRQVIGRMFRRFHYYDGHAPGSVSGSASVKAMRVYWDKRTRRFGGKHNIGTRWHSAHGLDMWL